MNPHQRRILSVVFAVIAAAAFAAKVFKAEHRAEGVRSSVRPLNGTAGNGTGRN